METKISRTLLLIIIGVIFTSCNFVDDQKQTEREVNILPAEGVIEAERMVRLPDLSLIHPHQIITVDDDFLVILERRNEEFVTIISLPDLEFKYSWGTAGRGPGEFISGASFVTSEDGSLVLYDPILMQLRYFEIGETELHRLNERPLHYNEQVDPLNRIQKVNSDLYFVDYGTSNEETEAEHIALEPGNEEPLFTFGNYPESELEGFERYGEYVKSNQAGPDGEKFAAFYLTHNKFNIYTSDGELLHHITVEDPDLSESNIEASERYLFRHAFYANKDFIWVAGYYSDRDELFGQPDKNLRTSLEIWSWDGESVFRTMFDRGIHGFTVSEQNNSLYGYSVYDEDTIYEYDISSILEELE